MIGPRAGARLLVISGACIAVACVGPTISRRIGRGTAGSKQHMWTWAFCPIRARRLPAFCLPMPRRIPSCSRICSRAARRANGALTAAVVPISKDSRPTSVSTTAILSASRSTRTSTHYRIDIYRIGYYGGDGARKVATIDETLPDGSGPTHSAVRSGNEAGGCRQLERVCDLGCSGRCGLGRLLRQADAPRWRRRREHHSVHRPGRRAPQRYHFPDLRHDVAGIQPVGWVQSLRQHRWPR